MNNDKQKEQDLKEVLDTLGYRVVESQSKPSNRGIISEEDKDNE